ncbi:lectin-like [Lissotriton helveticus]
MEESRRLGDARSRVLLLCVTLFFTVGWVDSGVTPGTLRKTTYKRRHPDGGERWKRNTEWVPRNDFSYRYITAQMPWIEAEVHCQRLAPGSHLTSAHNKEDIEYLKNLVFLNMRFHRGYWLGASDLYKKKLFMWTDGSAMDFKSWHPEEPYSSGGLEHCISANYKGPGLWGLVKCDTTLTFICKAPNPSQDKPLC